MADIVNLRLARKRRARAEAEKTAAANRAAFGRPKREREREEALRSLSERRHESHRRTGGRDEDEEEPGR